MESLSDTKWDVVISGTGLQQSLLALALSRSGKNILHIDPNQYYGQAEAALSLQEVEEWAVEHQSASPNSVFSKVQVTKDGQGPASPRAYSLALAPQLVHTKAELISQLVSSKAFRQIEFLAVGSFYIFQPPSDSEPVASLSRIPSTREDVFSNTAIPAKSKRSLMKFLKFVLDYESEAQAELWKPHADAPLVDFLKSQFKLDTKLQSYVITLTLSHDGNISVASGLAIIYKHMTSMGLFGAGFAAIYPKYGGLSEVAQVGCRAAAVGGAVYMLGTGMKKVSKPEGDDAEQVLQIALTNDIDVQTKLLVQSTEKVNSDIQLSRLTAVVESSLSSVFNVVIEGAPTPAVAVVAFPPSSVSTKDGQVSTYPIYAMIHSSDTGECPSSKCVVYLSTVTSADSHGLLVEALSSLLSTITIDGDAPSSSFQVYYEQKTASSSVEVDGPIIRMPQSCLDLAFNDDVMNHVRAAWDAVTRADEATDGAGYMTFEDREGVDDDPFD
ncbi:unnamed protein product [Clonostachys byssicola]|uniref:Rab proteins geranylgeranyltransferase n=1 Tax=Clonostachys byssicola TaxID=160290 RepID=A0A9N9UPE6_9HYPO|nr:unnamed protein product [Clonostachys byssicola]